MKLYKFKSLEKSEHVYDIIINEQLFCACFKQLNDPFEGLFFIILGAFSKGFSAGFDRKKEEFKRVVERFKICSLSQKLSDVRMWSFYANGHKGIAIEIDFTGLEKDVEEVKYSKGLPEFNLTNPDPVEILTKKTDHWEYESEYRIIQKSTYYSIKERIKAIYLGENILDIHKKILKKIVPFSIPIYKTKLDKKEIEIKSGELEPR